MRYLIFILCLLASNYPIYGKEVNDKVVEQFKFDLKQIKSIAVDFVQSDSKNTFAEGKLLINKPYKFRCNYYAPYPLVIIGNKNYVSVYDFEMDQLSRITVKENIFNFLLIDNIDFDRHFNIEEAIDVGDAIEVTIFHVESERRSRIAFDKATHHIKQIEIFEDDNVITLKLSNFRQVKNFEGDLFIIKNPDLFGAPERLDKSKLEKKITF